MSTFLALVLLTDFTRGKTPCSYADSAVSNGELLDNMTATHGTGEVRVVALAEVRDFLIKSFTLFIRHSVHTGYVFFVGTVTPSFRLPMFPYCCFFFFGRHCIPFIG